MTAYSLLFIVTLLGGLFCIGGFMWSAMESKPQKIWLVGAAITILVGIAGVVMHS